MPGFRASRYVDAGGLASFKPKRRIGLVSSIFPGFQGFVLAVTSSKLAGFGFFLAKTTGFPRNPVNIIPSRRILFWRILFASTRTFSYSLLHIWLHPNRMRAKRSRRGRLIFKDSIYTIFKKVPTFDRYSVLQSLTFSFVARDRIRASEKIWIII